VPAEYEFYVQSIPSDRIVVGSPSSDPVGPILLLHRSMPGSGRTLCERPASNMAPRPDESQGSRNCLCWQSTTSRT